MHSPMRVRAVRGKLRNSKDGDLDRLRKRCSQMALVQLFARLGRGHFLESPNRSDSNPIQCSDDPRICAIIQHVNAASIAELTRVDLRVNTLKIRPSSPTPNRLSAFLSVFWTKSAGLDLKSIDFKLSKQLFSISEIDAECCGQRLFHRKPRSLNRNCRALPLYIFYVQSRHFLRGQRQFIDRLEDCGIGTRFELSMCCTNASPYSDLNSS
jgi:hypothetical protein